MSAPHADHQDGAGPRRGDAFDLIDGLFVTIADLHALLAGGSPHARDAGLAAAYEVLRLAVTPVVAAADRQARWGAIRVALPALARAGLSHVAGLVAAALASDVDPASVARGVERPQ